MDLALIVKDIRTHKRIALPVLLLTLLAAAYVAVGRSSEYQSDASVVLINSPAAPTITQIAANPALAKGDANNPYVAYGDLSVVVDLVQQAMASQAIVDRLKSEGVSDGYTVLPSPEAAAPIMEITGDGFSAGSAERAAGLVDEQVAATLDQLQRSDGVTKPYWITTQVLSAPTPGKIVLSHKLRDVIAVLALGLVMMVVVLSARRGMVDRADSRQSAGAPETDAISVFTTGSPPQRLPNPSRLSPRPTAASSTASRTATKALRGRVDRPRRDPL